MTTLALLRLLIVAAAMLVAAVAGYLFARYRMRLEADTQIAIMSGELMKMRRRTGAAEAEAQRAYATVTRERRKHRRRA